MKAVIVIVLVLVLAALASAGLFMLRKGPRDDGAAPDARMARALAMRIGLSIALFLFILFSYWMGWIQPTGIPR